MSEYELLEAYKEMRKKDAEIEKLNNQCRLATAEIERLRGFVTDLGLDPALVRAREAAKHE